MRWHEAAPLPFPPRTPPRRAVDGALAATLWFEPTAAVLVRVGATELAPMPDRPAHRPRRWSPAETLLRHAVPLTVPVVRPYFAVCALEAWRRVPVRKLAAWSEIPFTVLKRLLAARSLTPAGVAAWNFALHATWLLDVAELPAGAVVSCMRLGRTTALGVVLGARGVSFVAGRVQSGAFAATLNRYLHVLRVAFRA